MTRGVLRRARRSGARLTSLALLGAAALALGGCDAPDPDAPQRVAVGGFSMPGSPDERLWRDFERRIIEGTEGRLKPAMLIRGEAGPEESMIAEMRRGRRIQVAGGSFQGMATIVPEIAVISAPFLFDSVEEVDFVMDEYVFEPLAELFAEQGVVLFQYTEVGWVNIYAQKPVVELDDVRGYPLRAASSLAALHFVETIGADTKPLPFTEIVPALQTGLIRGGATSITMYHYGGVRDEAGHLSLSRHSYDFGAIVANARWFEQLDPADQEVLRRAFGGHERVRGVARASVEETLEHLVQSGIEVHEWSDANRAVWAERAWQEHPRLIRRIGGRAQELYDLILEGKAEFARREGAAD